MALFRFEHMETNHSEIHFLEYGDFNQLEFIDVLNLDERERCFSFRHPKRQREFIATRILKARIFGNKSIEYNAYGAPFIRKEGHISISHSRALVAIAVNPFFQIGLDLESFRSGILELYPKFTSPEEQREFDTTSTREMTKVWSAKEALYKLAGRKKIHFAQELLLTKTLVNNEWRGKIINPDHELYVKLNIFERKDTVVSINSDAVVKRY